MPHNRNILIFAFIATFLALWGLLMYLVGPERIVEYVGVENSYILMFVIALVGGASTLTAPSLFTALITFAAAGLNPLILGVMTGVGLTLSDSLFFYFGLRGRMLLGGKWLERSLNLRRWFLSKPSWVPPLIVFLYTGFTPLPNDFLTVSAALAHIRFRQIVLSLLLGNTTLAIIIASLSN